MKLNPGKWTLCHALKCKSLNGMECSGECPYKTEGEKFKAFRTQRKAFFDAVQDKQNTPRLVTEKAKVDKLNSDAFRKAESIRGGRS